MEYIPILLAFISACVALKGNTWNASGSGIDKLTNTGKLAFTLILFASIYSVSTAYSAREKQAKSNRDKERISKIIDFEITKSLSHILSPFRSLYIEYNGKGYVPDEEITIELLLEEVNLKKAQGVCLELRPTSFVSFPDSGTWNDIFRVGISSGINRLESLQVRYSHQMSSDLLESIHNLIEKGYFSKFALFNPIPLTNESTEDDLQKLPPCVIGQAIGSHKEYLTMISKVYESNKSNVYQR